MHVADAASTSALADKLRAGSEVFARHPEIAVVYLFGSRARNEARIDSDLDLGIVYMSHDQRRDAHERVALRVAADVAKITGISQIDVIDLEEQGPIFCHRVLCEGTPIFVADTARRVDFESDAMTRAFDFRPTYELAIAGKIAGLRRWLKEHHDAGAGSVEAGHPKSESR